MVFQRTKMIRFWVGGKLGGTPAPEEEYIFFIYFFAKILSG